MSDPMRSARQLGKTLSSCKSYIQMKLETKIEHIHTHLEKLHMVLSSQEQVPVLVHECLNNLFSLNKQAILLYLVSHEY
ncbi:unnamed protein product [Trifolium pratense]|uniref:Uncharacterized protein n=1 Tax=Trifolium pratense TaxID=57577 RepID=A0ACB0JDT0_TRIPR|nr:unnamed protein product [Trifolium pratense]